MTKPRNYMRLKKTESQRIQIVISNKLLTISITVYNIMGFSKRIHKPNPPKTKTKKIKNCNNWSLITITNFPDFLSLYSITT